MMANQEIVLSALLIKVDVVVVPLALHSPRSLSIMILTEISNFTRDRYDSGTH